jgi:hypothetical protein
VAGDVNSHVTIEREAPHSVWKIAPYPSEMGGFSPTDPQGGGMHDSFMTSANPLEPPTQAIERPETVVQLRRPAISTKVIGELLRLDYLQPAKRYKPHVVERALARLRADLVRDGVVKSGNSLGDPISPAADDNQPSASGPGAST